MRKWFFEKAQAKIDLEDIESILERTSTADGFLQEISYKLEDDWSPEVTLTLPEKVRPEAIKAQAAPLTIREMEDNKYILESEIARLCEYDTEDEADHWEVSAPDAETSIWADDDTIRLITIDGKEITMSADEVVQTFKNIVENENTQTYDLEFMPEVSIRLYDIIGAEYYLEVEIELDCYTARLVPITSGYTTRILAKRHHDIKSYNNFLAEAQALIPKYIKECNQGLDM